MIQKFFAIVKARTMEFVRDRGTFFWNLLFPVVMVAGFSFAFQNDGATLFKVGLAGDRSGAALFNMEEFLSIPQLEIVDYEADQTDELLDKLSKHQLDMVVDIASKTWWINEESSSGPLLRRLVPASETGFTEQKVSGKAIRYVDYLVPGVIGMNMMFSCLFGVGFVLVRYRKNGVLKRLKATPVGAFTFLSAQAVSRMLIVIATSIAVFAGTNAFLHFRMEGSYLDLFVLLLLAIFSMISLGLVFASRIASEELASGLMNLVTFPMMILSGVFFSLEGSPEILLTIARIFPLTHFLEAARAVMLDGAGLMDLLPQVAYLGILSVVFLAVSSVLFKWE